MNTFLKSLLIKATISNERLLEVLARVTVNNTDEILRLMAYLTCAEDKPKIPAKISNDSIQAELLSYDIVNNTVYYDGYKKCTRYYLTNEAAEANENKYEGVSMTNDKYSSWNTGDYNYPTQVWIKVTDSMPLDKWK